MKIAIIGSGVSGLVTAYLANENGHEAHLFEKADYFGGHSNTIKIDDGKSQFWADTGFLVHNPQTYPNLIQLLNMLSVKTIDSQMTLSVQILSKNLEWGGTNLSTLFAQKKNLLRPAFFRMVIDLLRFNRQAPQLLAKLQGDTNITLRQLLAENGFSKEFQDWYIIPMAAAIWSTPANKILEFPAFTFLQFGLNHSLFQVDGRPIWRTIEGGAREYVRRITDRIPNKYLNTEISSLRRINGKVELKTKAGVLMFDQVVFATHADQARETLIDQDEQESDVLAAFRFQKNRAIVHFDSSLLPVRRKLWSAWNYTSSSDANQVSVSYLLNELQRLPTKTPIIVSLNPHKEISPEKVIRKIDYDHPIFDGVAIRAQKKMEDLQGRGGIFYAGAWLGYGFHEDGVKSALRVARLMKWKIPWDPVYE